MRRPGLRSHVRPDPGKSMLLRNCFGKKSNIVSVGRVVVVVSESNLTQSPVMRCRLAMQTNYLLYRYEVVLTRGLMKWNIYRSGIDKIISHTDRQRK